MCIFIGLLDYVCFLSISSHDIFEKFIMYGLKSETEKIITVIGQVYRVLALRFGFTSVRLILSVRFQHHISKDSREHFSVSLISAFLNNIELQSAVYYVFTIFFLIPIVRCFFFFLWHNFLFLIIKCWFSLSNSMFYLHRASFSVRRY